MKPILMTLTKTGRDATPVTVNVSQILKIEPLKEGSMIYLGDQTTVSVAIGHEELIQRLREAIAHAP